uniref:Delta-ctenitoxin-Pn2c n=1 Tax=Phoneutria nigriventer TaxID=6918 RepID=A0A6M5WQU6_PHONI|nr:delta-ctenitoxin-Pn2c [Phoneutria nigriventer]
MKVAILFLSILVLAVASESIEESRDDFAVEELERATCAGQDQTCKVTCDCCGERGECVCGGPCICRQGNFLIAWYKLASCKK